MSTHEPWTAREFAEKLSETRAVLLKVAKIINPATLLPLRPGTRCELAQLRKEILAVLR